MGIKLIEELNIKWDTIILATKRQSKENDDAHNWRRWKVGKGVLRQPSGVRDTRKLVQPF